MGNAEMDSSRQATAAQHQERRESLLQADCAERHVISRASDRTADVARIRGGNAADTCFTLSDAQQL
jgi:hypothetical protein